MKRYQAHEFAQRAGVTVRTLHHYDRLGLLKATRRTRAGYRLYSDPDLLRLEQIVVLKSIGLTLKETRELLQRDRSALQDTLARQQRVLTEKRKQLDKAIRASQGRRTPPPVVARVAGKGDEAVERPVPRHRSRAPRGPCRPDRAATARTVA